MLFQVQIDGADWFGPLPSFEDGWQAIRYAKGLLAQIPHEPPFYKARVTIRNQEGAVVFSCSRARWRFEVAAHRERAYDVMGAGRALMRLSPGNDDEDADAFHLPRRYVDP
jgi:hypothetical protein